MTLDENAKAEPSRVISFCLLSTSGNVSKKMQGGVASSAQRHYFGSWGKTAQYKTAAVVVPNTTAAVFLRYK